MVNDSGLLLIQNRGGTPQNLRDSKQRKELRKKIFGKRLQEHTCEQAVNSNFSMDIGWNIGVES